jgi:lipoprotein-anchoring transpeptidase ErfK/SrfK
MPAHRANPRLLACALAALLVLPCAFAAPAPGIDADPDADADLLAAPDALAPGEFEWQPGWDASSPAPVTIVISLDDQRAYVFRDGRRIGTSTVSSGKPGHETPTGVFGILQKKKMHHSNLYENEHTGKPAAMPWMQRLTWDGVALHAGRVRAQPASHGCVRLPAEFARQLYGITRTGGTVVVARNGSIAALAEAGADAPMALLFAPVASLREIAGNVVAGEHERAFE